MLAVADRDNVIEINEEDIGGPPSSGPGEKLPG